MNKIKVLDCTLRDGGYCNDWKFGFDNEKKIVNSLIEANIDIIECGFLTNKVVYEKGISKFTDVNQVTEILPKNNKDKMFVCLMNYGEYFIEDLPECDGKSITGIRIAFHKKDMIDALELGHKIKQKGYKVFIQPMVTLNYSDEEFLKLIKLANELEPEAFYIVDSFGMMKRKNLIRLFYMIEHNLKEEIYIGFHSHNNMQLSFSNAQTLVDTQTNRNIIIDTSVFGMGRGAGNLNTELFVEYLNDNANGMYYLKPLLQVIDEVLNHFYYENYWGYSLPNYLSASYNTHPNYAEYLSKKNTLTIENIDEIFMMIENSKRGNFDKKYIEELYVRYMETGNTNSTHINELENQLKGKTILIIAPGKSSFDECEKIKEFASRSNVISISVNFDYSMHDTDYIFLSNLRRFKELPKNKRNKAIVTSNIPSDGVYLQTQYRNLLNNNEAIKDNAGMMLIKYLIDFDVKEIVIAGMDGYSHDNSENYFNNNMQLINKSKDLDTMNYAMTEILKDYSKKININFLTKIKYVTV